MDRRNFLKVSAVGTAVAGIGATPTSADDTVLVQVDSEPTIPTGSLIELTIHEYEDDTIQKTATVELTESETDYDIGENSDILIDNPQTHQEDVTGITGESGREWEMIIGMEENGDSPELPFPVELNISTGRILFDPRNPVSQIFSGSSITQGPDEEPEGQDISDDVSIEVRS